MTDDRADGPSEPPAGSAPPELKPTVRPTPRPRPLAVHRRLFGRGQQGAGAEGAGRALRLHRWLAQRMFYPLLGASLLALTLFAVQWFSSGWYGPRMHVNLALAWVPYLAALWAVAMRAWTKWRRWLLVFPVPVWLVFFPNAPYMVTDFVYLRWLDADTWLQIGIFMAFALCGLYLAVASLYLMHTLVRGAFGLFAGWVVVWAAIVASGIGIFVGRFLRWNSWELFTRPDDLWLRAGQRLSEPAGLAGPLAFSVMFSLMLAVFYFMFLAVRRSAASPEELAAEQRELTDWQAEKSRPDDR